MLVSFLGKGNVTAQLLDDLSINVNLVINRQETDKQVSV